MRNAFLPPPDGVPCIGLPKTYSPELQAYCTYVDIGQRVSLCEYKDGQYYYSVTIQADETPLVICALDYFITDNLNQEAGRRCDFICMGWYNGECYIAFVELRKELDIEDHFQNKLEQVKQTIELLCRENVIYGNSLHRNVPKIFKQACEPVQPHRIIGLVIPAIHSKRKAEQSQMVSIEGNGDVPIVAIPHRILREGETTWTSLIQNAVPKREQEV